MKRDLCAEANDEATSAQKPRNEVVPAEEVAVVQQCALEREQFNDFMSAGEAGILEQLEWLECTVGSYNIEQASCFHISVHESRIQLAKDNYKADKCKHNWFVCKALSEIPGSYFKVHPACFQ